jgi:hypothetical protein
MASFAKIGLNNKVIEVVSVNNEVIKDSSGVEREELGIQFLNELYKWPIWKQTSYNTHSGIHNNGGTPFRKNHAAIGYIYDEVRDAFIPPKTFNSWILNEEKCIWEAPIPYPNDGQDYIWNEQTVSWKKIDIALTQT